MHFQKLCAVICGVTFLVASSLTLKADDTDAQAKAREALRKAMEELNAQKGKPAPAKPAAPNVSVKETPPAPAPAPAPKPEPVVPAPAPVAPAAVAPTPVPEPAPAGVAPATASGFPQSKLSAEDQERVLEAMRQQKAKLDAAEQAGMKSKAPAVAIGTGNGADQAEMRKAAAEQQKREREMQKMAAKTGAPVTPPPADMTPGSKEQRLYELLQKYKADQISPSEYHQQRAKILAE